MKKVVSVIALAILLTSNVFAQESKNQIVINAETDAELKLTMITLCETLKEKKVSSLKIKTKEQVINITCSKK